MRLQSRVHLVFLFTKVRSPRVRCGQDLRRKIEADRRYLGSHLDRVHDSLAFTGVSRVGERRGM